MNSFSTTQKVSAVVVAIILAVGLFYGGVAYGKSQSPRSQFGARNGMMGGFGGGSAQNGQGQARLRNTNGGFVAGEIISKDAQSVTVKLSDGGSKIIYTSASTTVYKTAEGSMSDLSQGTNVTVQGSTNSDGSITAQSIQIRPAGAQGMMQSPRSR